MLMLGFAGLYPTYLLLFNGFTPLLVCFKGDLEN
jgi:hypothetical protein